MSDKLAAALHPGMSHDDELAYVAEINANLPFADPIAPVIEWAHTEFPLVAGYWLTTERFRKISR